MATELKAILNSMRADIKYKRLRQSFEQLPIYQIAVDTMLEEISVLHKMREIRRLNPSDPRFVDQLIRANTTDQSQRGRLTEILMTCIRAIQSLTRACNALKQHLLTTHSQELRSFRTKEERSNVIDLVLAPFMRYVHKVQLLADTAKLVIDDITSGSWSLKLSVQALQIERTRESTI